MCVCARACVCVRVCVCVCERERERERSFQLRHERHSSESLSLFTHSACCKRDNSTKHVNTSKELGCCLKSRVEGRKCPAHNSLPFARLTPLTFVFSQSGMVCTEHSAARSPRPTRVDFSRELAILSEVDLWNCLPAARGQVDPKLRPQ